MKLSTQSRYGVRAIFDIAYHSNGLQTKVQDISRRQEISPRYIEQIFQKLRKAGVIGSRRGPSGGYFLKKKPEEITVGEIIRITEGGLSLVACGSPPKNSKKSCKKSGACATQLIWTEAGNRLSGYFDSITIKDLCGMAEEMGLEKERDQRFTYYI